VGAAAAGAPQNIHSEISKRRALLAVDMVCLHLLGYVRRSNWHQYLHMRPQVIKPFSLPQLYTQFHVIHLPLQTWSSALPATQALRLFGKFYCHSS
jgi:hypothetical protein